MNQAPLLARLGVATLILGFVVVRLTWRWSWRPEEREARALPRERLLTTLVTLSLFLPPLLWGLPAVASLDLPAPLGLRLLGLALGLLGLAVVERAHAALRENFSPRLDLRADHTLTTRGPYRYVRHPMYTGGLLFAAGIGLCAANPVVGGPLLLTQLLLMFLRVPDEERMMRERFGAAWEAWAAGTGRILPRLGVRRRDEPG